MKNIEKMDPSLGIGASLKREDISFYNALCAPFALYGVSMQDGQYRRIPEPVAKTVSTDLYYWHGCTAGGRLRFKTNSSVVAISTKLPQVNKMGDFAPSGSIGYDLYATEEDELRFIKTYTPPVDIVDSYEMLIALGEKKEREVLLHFPNYSAVSELYIGLDADATVSKAPDYKYPKPFVAYGSSITQGGCASRPGSAYEAILSRRFDIDHINLGFAGCARAEDTIIEYVAGLDMSFFLYDYDHNAPTNEHYEKTHEKMFKAVRAAHPDMPILIMTRPKFYLEPFEEERRAIAYKTYQNALAAGDKRVWFMDGKQLMALCGNEGTVDNCHPTDYGFNSMAKALMDWIEQEKILEMI